MNNGFFDFDEYQSDQLDLAKAREDAAYEDEQQ